MLRWQEEGVNRLVGDPDKPEWVTTPIPPASDSKTVRTGTFRLSEDGALEGDVKIAYMGHPMIVRRNAWLKCDMSPKPQSNASSLMLRAACRLSRKRRYTPFSRSDRRCSVKVVPLRSNIRCRLRGLT